MVTRVCSYVCGAVSLSPIVGRKEVLTMKRCPVFDRECSGNDCKWWTPSETMAPDCVVFAILGGIRAMKARLIFIDEVVSKLASEHE